MNDARSYFCIQAGGLRIVAGLGLASLTSCVVYAASPNNEKQTKNVQNLQQLKPPSKDQTDGLLARKQTICKSKLEEALAKTRELCEKAQVEHGLPGLVIAVSVNGKIIYDEGYL